MQRLPFPIVGFAKRQMMEQQEQGWDYSDQRVCTACVDDYALEAAIRDGATSGEPCDFCGGMPSAPLDDLLRVFVAGLFNEYEDAIEEVSWDSREGGYQTIGPQWDTDDLIWDYADVLVGEGLVESLQRQIHERIWVEKDFAWRRRDEVLTESWDQFCEAVKYKTRYVFWLTHQEDDDEARYTGEVPPGRILEEIGRLLGDLDLCDTLPAGYKLWRAQDHEETTIDRTAARLGTAPVKYATQANRMSPAGIPMFYGSDDPSTAVREVAAHAESDRVTYGQFETSRPSVVVDFTKLRPIPSMFDPEWGAVRRVFVFLHRFVEQLSQPVRTGQELIDYVPTQIITEYLLRVYEEGSLVMGLLYRSAITGGVNAVLDVPNSCCVEQSEGWRDEDTLKLGLLPDSVFTRPIEPKERKAET